MQINLINEIQGDLTPVEQIMVNRGIAKEDIHHYMNTTDADINSFLDLDNMKEAVKLLNKHIKQNSNILIQVD